VISLPEALPITLVLAVLVSIFLSLERHAPRTRVRLWAYAWALTFMHFFARAMETRVTAIPQFFVAIDFATLEFAALVFLASLLFEVADRHKRITFLTILGLPILSHAFAIGLNLGSASLQAELVASIALAAVAFTLLVPTRRRKRHLFLAAILASVGIWASYRQAHHHEWGAIVAVLTISLSLSGIYFLKGYRRTSLGVVTATVGFFAWAAEYPLGVVLHVFYPNFQATLDFWNVPRILVALGMVLTLLEERTRALENARSRAEAESVLLQRLSNITSRLLAGNDPGSLCGEVTSAITEASSFRCAALFLLGEDRRFYLAGVSGFTRQEAETLQVHSSSYAIESMKQLSASSGDASDKSFRMSQSSDLTLIPMVSWRGSHIGCLYLADSRNAGGTDKQEMVRLEVFASDLAVTFENVRLHQQLVRSEKLAGLGQLVAGVAHELNNPLTGIIGFTDLLTEEVREEKALKRLEKLGNEARRMKRIVDGLLRFGRQNNSVTRSTALDAVVRDVVQLREYHLRTHSIGVDVRLESPLAPIGIAEDELKQLLLNVLNNAIDAVEESARREIRIRAFNRAGRAVIQFEDSGPGFSDLARAFDPFYTTKPVGKGTGLGLSICYGIVQECGGEIMLSNLQPYGACVSVDLPFAVAQPALVEPAKATWW
jgi:two-component system, NtrC family, sensor kinase